MVQNGGLLALHARTNVSYRFSPQAAMTSALTSKTRYRACNSRTRRDVQLQLCGDEFFVQAASFRRHRNRHDVAYELGVINKS